MSSTRLKYLRPGQCFIHRNDIYIKTSEDYAHTVVNLKTGRVTTAIRPNARVSTIHLNLQIVDPREEFDPIDAGAVWRSGE